MSRAGPGRISTDQSNEPAAAIDATEQFTLPAGTVLFLIAHPSIPGAFIASGDNASFFWDDANNRLGIGTSSPGAPLHVVGAIVGTTTLGPSASQQHTIPAVASDTYVLLAATQTFTNKTLTGPVIQGTVGAGTGLTMPTFDLANADTTVSRSAAGVMAVEGVDQVSVSGTQTLTNKTLSGAVVTGAAPATPTANVLYTDSIVKGWVRFQLDGTIDDDVNVSSVTDNGAGDWTVNWATAFASANYAAIPGILGRGSSIDTIISLDPANAPTTTACRIMFADNAPTKFDPAGATVRIYLIAIGDQ